MFPRLTMLLAAVAAVVLVAAGCGGSDDNGGNGSGEGSSEANITVTTSSLTKPQFVKKATDVCEREIGKLVERSEAYAEKSAKNQSPAYEEGVEAVLLPLLQGQVEGITKLGAPSGDEEEVEAMLTSRQQAIDDVKAMHGYESIQDIAGQFTESNKLMRKYGLVKCQVIAEPT